MKIYQITFRHGSVTDTHSISACNAKRAKKYAKKIYSDWPGWYLYTMYRVF